MLAEPVDFKALEDEGVLTKEGAWYRIHDFDALPERVLRKAHALTQDSKGVKIKLRKAERLTAIARKFAMLSRDEK